MPSEKQIQRLQLCARCRAACSGGDVGALAVPHSRVYLATLMTVYPSASNELNAIVPCPRHGLLLCVRNDQQNPSPLGNPRSSFRFVRPQLTNIGASHLECKSHCTYEGCKVISITAAVHWMPPACGMPHFPKPPTSPNAAPAMHHPTCNSGTNVSKIHKLKQDPTYQSKRLAA
jgi:hypothetical protein